MKKIVLTNNLCRTMFSLRTSKGCSSATSSCHLSGFPAKSGYNQEHPVKRPRFSGAFLLSGCLDRLSDFAIVRNYEVSSGAGGRRGRTSLTNLVRQLLSPLYPAVYSG